MEREIFQLNSHSQTRGGIESEAWEKSQQPDFDVKAVGFLLGGRARARGARMSSEQHNKEISTLVSVGAHFLEKFRSTLRWFWLLGNDKECQLEGPAGRKAEPPSVRAPTKSKKRKIFEPPHPHPIIHPLAFSFLCARSLRAPGEWPAACYMLHGRVCFHKIFRVRHHTRKHTHTPSKRAALASPVPVDKKRVKNMAALRCCLHLIKSLSLSFLPAAPKFILRASTRSMELTRSKTLT